MTKWSTLDLLMIVQTMHKTGFIEWSSIGKRLKNNPFFTHKEEASPEIIKNCEAEFNAAFREFLDNSEFLQEEPQDLQSCLAAFAKHLLDLAIKETESQLVEDESEILERVTELNAERAKLSASA